MSLLLPHGLGRRTTETISAEEMDWLAKGEHMCRKMNTTIICRRCRKTLSGQNDESDAVIKVWCDCGEKVFRHAV